MCGARIASITGSGAFKLSATKMIVSITTSHSTVTITRRPGNGYGIQVSACVQARSEAASSAGQTVGMSNLDGHTPRNRVANHSIAMAAAP